LQPNQYNLDEVAAELLERRAAARSLHEFVKQAWPWVEGGREFVDGWHLGCIAEHLEATYRGEIRNLLVNVPPRFCKSTLVSVMFPAWVWLQNPSLQFLYVSYALNLSMRDSVRCRRVIESPWYQSRWGSQFQLQGDQSTKIRFDNTRLGYRIATSVDGTLTGEGGDFLICDDPNNIRDERSETSFKSAIEWFTQVFSTRMNDPKTGRKIVIQQRAGEEDISGHILANEKEDWIHLCLPFEFEPERRCRTVALPSTKGKPWEDPRTKAGELLWPERMGIPEMKALKKALKSEMAVAGQLQQRPAPAEGGIIKRDWFKLWPAQKPFPAFEYIVQSYDTAFTEAALNDPSACTTWGIFPSEGKWCAMLLDCWEDWLDYPSLRRRAIEEASSLYGDPPRAIDMVLIENKASGPILKTDMALAGLPVKLYNPGKADKIQRTHMVSHLIQNGLIYLPESDKEERRGRVRTWVEPFVDQVAMFPNGRHDDMHDTMTQTLLVLKDMRLLEGESVPYGEEEDLYEPWEKEGSTNPYAV